MTPAAYRWTGEAFEPLPRFRAECDRTFAIGEVYVLEQRQDRSPKSHAHFFAQLADHYGTLPDHMADRWPSDEHFRKWLLVQAGWCTMTQHVCASKAEAERSRKLAERMDDYAVVLTDECVVTVYTAKSQAKTAMDRRAFQQVKDQVFDIIAGLLGTTADEAKRAEAA